MTNSLLWSVAETAKRLGDVSTKTVRRLVQDHELPAVRLKRRIMIDPDDVAALIIRNKIGRPEHETNTSCHSTDETQSGGCDSPHQTDVEIRASTGTADRRQAQELHDTRKAPSGASPNSARSPATPGNRPL
jgi:excisionase family DNA binding protein